MICKLCSLKLQRSSLQAILQTLPTSSITCSQALLLLRKPKLIRRINHAAPEHIFSQYCHRPIKFWVCCSRGHRATPEGAEGQMPQSYPPLYMNLSSELKGMKNGKWHLLVVIFGCTEPHFSLPLEHGEVPESPRWRLHASCTKLRCSHCIAELLLFSVEICLLKQLYSQNSSRATKQRLTISFTHVLYYLCLGLVFLTKPYPALLVRIKEMMTTEITRFLFGIRVILSIFVAIYLLKTETKWTNERERNEALCKERTERTGMTQSG